MQNGPTHLSAPHIYAVAAEVRYCLWISDTMYWHKKFSPIGTGIPTWTFISVYWLRHRVSLVRQLATSLTMCISPRQDTSRTLWENSWAHADFVTVSLEIDNVDFDRHDVVLACLPFKCLVGHVLSLMTTASDPMSPLTVRTGAE